jgi:ribose transport system substrate-binding protein
MTTVKAGLSRRVLLSTAAAGAALSVLPRGVLAQQTKHIAYLTPGLDLPYWRILGKGVSDVAAAQGAQATIYDSHNDAQTQLQNAQDALARNVDGIVLSPTDSSTAPAVLAAAKRANVPVVIADIGTTGGQFAAFTTSNNEAGAYKTGLALAQALKAKGWTDGTVGIVSISLARKNGQLRTAGFRKAMQENGIKEAALSQMQAYTADETFHFVQDMLTAHPEMRGVFVQTDAPSLGAVRAIQAARRDGEVLLAAFDGIPEFVPLIENGKITVAGMQQPYLMGTKAAGALFEVFGGKTPEKQIEISIQVVTKDNLQALLPTLKQNVFGEGKA